MTYVLAQSLSVTIRCVGERVGINPCLRGLRFDCASLKGGTEIGNAMSVFFVQAQRQLLVIPLGTEPAVPTSLRDMSWRPLADASLADKLFTSARPIVDAQIDASGYALMTIEAGLK